MSELIEVNLRGHTPTRQTDSADTPTIRQEMPELCLNPFESRAPGTARPSLPLVFAERRSSRTSYPAIQSSALSSPVN